MQRERYMRTRKMLRSSCRYMRTRKVLVCADGLLDVLACAGDGAYGPVLESTPYIAEDLIADIAPRVEVLRSFASGLSG